MQYLLPDWGLVRSVSWLLLKSRPRMRLPNKAGMADSNGLEGVFELGVSRPQFVKSAYTSVLMCGLSFHSKPFWAKKYSLDRKDQR